jgi:alkylation response protein AidB-like acyl-CoA dehydrogenase
MNHTAIDEPARVEISADSRQKADQLISWLRGYAEQRINSLQIDERRMIPPNITLDFGNQGLFGMQIEERWGGLGLSVTDTLRVVAQVAAIDQSLALITGLNNSLVIRPIIRHASAAAKADLLPKLASGRIFASFALSELASGSNPNAITTVARADGAGNWHINGAKTWIGNGSWATVHSVFVRLEDSDGNPDGIGAFIVRSDTPGLTIGEEILTFGMRGTVQNSLFFDDVVVGNENMLGVLGQGIGVAHEAMMMTRLGVGAISIGCMKRCAQLAARYATRRTVATGRLIDNPATIAYLDEMLNGTTACETLIERTANLCDAGISVPDEIFAAIKSSAPELAWAAADRLMQLTGGRGYVEPNGISRILRDIRLMRIIEGPTETMYMYLGARLIHRRKGLYEFLVDQFEAPETTDLLRQTAREVLALYRSNDAPFADKGQNLHWAYSCMGEIATWGILLAALEQPARQGGDALQAARWLRQRFDAACARVLHADGVSLPDSAEILTRIERYAKDIGDIEKQLANPQYEAHEILKRDL